MHLRSGIVENIPHDWGYQPAAAIGFPQDPTVTGCSAAARGFHGCQDDSQSRCISASPTLWLVNLWIVPKTDFQSDDSSKSSHFQVSSFLFFPNHPKSVHTKRPSLCAAGLGRTCSANRALNALRRIAWSKTPLRGRSLPSALRGGWQRRYSGGLGTVVPWRSIGGIHWFVGSWSW